MSYAAEVDSLVGIYSTIGRDARRGRSRKILGLAIAAAFVAGGSVAVVKSDIELSLPRLPAAFDSGEIESLVARVESGLVALNTVRAELEVERDRFAAKAAELETAIASFSERYELIAAQQQQLAAQSADLERTMAALDRQRAELLAAQRSSPAAERELAAMSEERQALEERRVDFASQSAQLSLELEELERRRNALESERAKAEQERAQLEALLESAGRGVPGRETTDPLATPASSPAELQAQAVPGIIDSPLTAGVVESSTLGDMRAGFVMDNGVNIAIGLTRTASINGEETISSSLNFDSLGAALQPGALESMGQFVVQNGSGNWLSPHLDGVPNSFFGSVVQNTVDNQQISTETVYDVTIQDVGSAVRGFSAQQALSDSLMFQR